MKQAHDYCNYGCMIAPDTTPCTCKACAGRLHGTLHGWAALDKREVVVSKQRGYKAA